VVRLGDKFNCKPKKRSPIGEELAGETPISERYGALSCALLCFPQALMSFPSLENFMMRSLAVLQEHDVGHGKTKRLGCLHVEHGFELCRLLSRLTQIRPSRLFASGQLIRRPVICQRPGLSTRRVALPASSRSKAKRVW